MCEYRDGVESMIICYFTVINIQNLYILLKVEVWNLFSDDFLSS